MSEQFSSIERWKHHLQRWKMSLFDPINPLKFQLTVAISALLTIFKVEPNFGFKENQKPAPAIIK